MFRHRRNNNRYVACHDWLTDPPVTNTTELIEMLDELRDNMNGLMEGVSEFAEWLKRADVDEHVSDMVAKAGNYGSEVCNHLSTAADNALHHYGDTSWPDFDKVR